MKTKLNRKVTITIELVTEKELFEWFALWDDPFIKEIVGDDIAQQLQIGVSEGYNPQTCIDFRNGLDSLISSYNSKEVG